MYGIHQSLGHDARVDAAHFVDDVLELDLVTEFPLFVEESLDRWIGEYALGTAKWAHRQTGIALRRRDHLGVGGVVRRGERRQER